MIGITERQGSGKLYYYTGGHIMRDDIPNHEAELIGKFNNYDELRKLMNDWYLLRGYIVTKGKNKKKIEYERFIERNPWTLDVDFGSWTVFLKIEYDG